MKTSHLFAAFVAVALVGCGSANNDNDQDAGIQVGTDSGTPGPVDAGNNKPDAGLPDAGNPDAGQPDAGQPDAGQPDAGEPDAGLPDAGPSACMVDTDNFGDLNALSGEAYFNWNDGSVVYESVLTDDLDLLMIRLYDGYGVFANGLQPGQYDLTGDELNFETCGACVFILANADDPNGEAYFATGGTLTLTAVGTSLTGTLSNVTFEHVTIDDQTAVSTPVGDGCTSAITSASFDEVIQ